MDGDSEGQTKYSKSDCLNACRGYCRFKAGLFLGLHHDHKVAHITRESLAEGKYGWQNFGSWIVMGNNEERASGLGCWGVYT